MTNKFLPPKIMKADTLKPDYDNAWWFSDNIDHWIKSKVNLKRKKDNEVKNFNRTKGRAQFL